MQFGLGLQWCPVMGKIFDYLSCAYPAVASFGQVEGHWQNPTIVTALVLLDVHLLTSSATYSAWGSATCLITSLAKYK